MVILRPLGFLVSKIQQSIVENIGSFSEVYIRFTQDGFQKKKQIHKFALYPEGGRGRTTQKFQKCLKYKCFESN